ncbi:MAG: ion transporter [Candidatus Yonathbacteria bacterium]|nr:ion transporter [Candidatus Yonathbacteria bacterium]
MPNKNIRALALKEKLDVPMAILAVLWVVVIVASLILEKDNPLRNSLDGLDWIIWFIFLAEYSALLLIAEEKIYYIRQNVLDLIIVFLPALRILRLVKVLEISKTATVFSETLRELSVFLHHKKIYHLLFMAFFVVATGGVLIHFIEASSNPIFERYAYSFWWAMATMVTFGHSDIYLTSPIGQTIGVFLVIFGICFALYLAFALISWFIKRGSSIKMQG